jgi:hypothetical protein
MFTIDGLFCILVCAIITINMASYSTQQGAVSDYNFCTCYTAVRTMRKKCVSESTEVCRCDRDGTCGQRQKALLGATGTGRKKLSDKRRKDSKDGVCVCVCACRPMQRDAQLSTVV